MLKHTAPAPRPPEPTPEELKKLVAVVHARVERMNRVTHLVGMLSNAELEAMILLVEAVMRDRRALEGLDARRAAEAVAYILPGDAF